MRNLSAPILAASLLAIAASLWLRDRLPERDGLVSALDAEPLQQPSTEAPFTVRAGERRYRVSPLFRYELSGLVVSRHDSAAWWDITHRDWGDRLNVLDLCVVWGANLRSNVYREVRYWSGTFTCNVGTDSQAVWARFDPDALSNNHLLAADPSIVAALRGLRIGDQVRLRGYLSEYAHDDGGPFRRGTSTVRTDRGDGACETIWVTGAEVLRANDRGWLRLGWVGGCGIVLAVVLWWLAPLRPRES